MSKYDVTVIGAGISGLTCASLLAKRGLKVCVVEAQKKPGGSCGIFKRNQQIFEQGAAMLYGFGELGFNPHRYLFNVLEEPITLVKHDHLYAINYGTERILFYEDMELFLKELIRVFPSEETGLRKFYASMSELYLKVIAETPLFVSPDVLSKEQGKEQFMNHPGAYLRFLSYMNLSMKKLLKKYFKGEEILNFFDKMTSTYCYATVEEAPAVLGAVMFIDNHFGGSYYPVGSTMQLVGKLEKVIEEHGGMMRYDARVSKIVTMERCCTGVSLSSGEFIVSERVVYSGNIWSLYNKLAAHAVSPKMRKWAKSLKPTYPSVVLYALVKKEVIPSDTLPIEMLISDKTKIDENEITVYFNNMDDETVASNEYYTLTAIGPSMRTWGSNKEEKKAPDQYKKKKQEEAKRMIGVLKKRFPQIEEGIVYQEIATPCSLERYVLKHRGAVAGPKQMLGQHMLKRQHCKTEVENLYCCGEGTVMGTGTPAVTASGIAAANLILRERHEKEYGKEEEKDNYVTIVKPPYRDEIHVSSRQEVNELAKKVSGCQFCEKPSCEAACPFAIPIESINRRLAVGNIVGSKKLLGRDVIDACIHCQERSCESACIRRELEPKVEIHTVLSLLNQIE